mgnify:CR=1 FL=1
MNPITLIYIEAAVVALLVFILLSYPLLKWLGVEGNLWERAIKFGASVFGIIAITQTPIGFFLGMGAGQVLSLVFVYLYVGKVIDAPTNIKVAVSIFFPILAALIVAPVFVLLVNAT